MFKALLGLAALLAATPLAAQQDRRIAVHNHLREPIYFLYWSNTATDDWGSDQLGDDVLMPGNRQVFDIDDGSGACRFDFKVVTKTGKEYTRANVDVCVESSVEFGPRVHA